MVLAATKLKLSVVLALVPLLASCKAVGQRQPNMKMDEAQKRFEGIGLVLVVDAVAGLEAPGVEFFSEDQPYRFYASAIVAKRNREIMSYPGGRVPASVRIVWRKAYQWSQIRWGSAFYRDDHGKPIEGALPKAGWTPEAEIARRQLIAKNTGVPHYGPWGSEYGGPLAGDYTMVVAERIPDAVLQDIRAKGGGVAAEVPPQGRWRVVWLGH